MIRPATIEDIPFIIATAHHAYGQFSDDRVAVWLKQCMADKNFMVLRGDHSSGVAYAYHLFYWRKPRGHILHVVSQPKGLSTEAIRLMRKMIEWLKAQGCFQVSFGSEIGLDYEPFARLLGASPAAPSYVIKFDKEPQYA